MTGAEALYADMGHFGRGPIRRAGFFLVFPALTLNYMGQGALILEHPEAIANPFFLTFPQWSRIPMIILATAATVIASQAVISGAFSTGPDRGTPMIQDPLPHSARDTSVSASPGGLSQRTRNSCAGRDACFSAREQSWRAGSTVRSLLSWTTDENQGCVGDALTEFGVISGDGSVAEVSPRALDRLL